ncbi:hypothetical protein HPB47_005338 [Ixodes persulcatus]|uniref:Uncharacterized protein n=1 Tax=Ixodes persulcatus TaxID=34615 RepID=A0AC60PDX8_IXOPE|nr:hypothetical protein HPB47_005338 [Ixodes persulcatus]
MSVLASMISAIGIVGATAHYYAYGLHHLWSIGAKVIVIPVVMYVIIPVLYKHKLTSIFQGGLRAVVWMDCVQAVLILMAPITIVGKVIYDSYHRGINHHSDMQDNIEKYIWNSQLNFREDENVWAYLVGMLASSLYREGLDQTVVQRFLAARCLRDARR